MSDKACSIASSSLCASAGCDHEGLPPRERGGHVQQLPGRGRALGRDGVPGGRCSDRHRHSHQVGWGVYNTEEKKTCIKYIYNMCMYTCILYLHIAKCTGGCVFRTQRGKQKTALYILYIYTYMVFYIYI